MNVLLTLASKPKAVCVVTRSQFIISLISSIAMGVTDGDLRAPGSAQDQPDEEIISPRRYLDLSRFWAATKRLACFKQIKRSAALSAVAASIL